MGIATLIRAIDFAARKHREQRRKGAAGSPYINHPIAVANILVEIGEVHDTTVLTAAILHDTIEDTETTAAELSHHFGEAVSVLVQEVTDDKSLPKARRKELQIQHAPGFSPEATLIKLGDKIHNVGEIANDPPPDWPLERRLEYLAWADSVIENAPAANANLELKFALVLAEARKKVESCS